MTLKMYWRQFKHRYLYQIVDYWFWYTSDEEIHVGDYYTDCGYIPRVATQASPYEITGVSLIDGTEGTCSVQHCGPNKITKEDAERTVQEGPLDSAIKQYLKDFYASEWGAGRTIWWKE